jgi:hypothetical protein
LRRFIITASEADLTSHAGLGLIGMALNERTNLATDAAAVGPLRRDAIAHADMLSSYVALLCLGKSDFEAINGFREDAYFAAALGLDHVPSEGLLRQRMDAYAPAYRRVVETAAIDFLLRIGAQLTPLDNGLMPLDCDVTPFDNSDSKKEGVSRTYKGMDGYAPMAAYLGQEGYCLEMELREGSQHCQKGTPAFLQRVLVKARQLTRAPLLLRLDSGNDALENIAVIEAHHEQDTGAPVHYIIKWNPRQEIPEHWLAAAETHAEWSTPRPGKRVALFDVRETRTQDGYTYPLRRVMRVIERTIDQRGQHLLVPDIAIEGWWTSLLWCDAQTVIALYADHGTSEQFHSEFKTDLDIERLPSGKFATNALVLACAVLAYNILRWLGQNGLLGADAPPRHRAKRRRLRTVMQELIDLAARLVHTGRRLKLAFAHGCPVVRIFQRLYAQLACT